MEIFRMEFYKIGSKRLVYLGLLGSLLFLAFYFQAGTVASETVYVDGQRLTGMEAIKKNLELAKEYSGPLTVQLAEDIIARYGWTKSIDELQKEEERGGVSAGYNDNFCNRFVTERLSNQRFGGDEPCHLATEEPVLMALMDGNLTLGYGGAWGGAFREMMMMVMLIAAILSIISVAPVFSEEYSLRTADLVLTTKKGKEGGAAAKILAAFAFSALLYIGMAALTFLAFASVFGVNGLAVSAELALPDQYYQGGVSAGPQGLLLARYLAAGLAANWAAVAVTLWISARSRQSVTALIWSIGAYLMPLALYFIVLSMMRMSRTVMRMMRIVRCLPALLPNNELMRMPESYRIKGYLLILALTAASLAAGLYRYRRYQAG